MCFDYLPDIKLKIKQLHGYFKINSDTHLLGKYLQVRKNETILDIGTNNGALLLYASIFSPKKMIGIDINKEAIEIARENMQLHNIKAVLINDSIQNLKINQVDVIVCNPPYFNCQNKNLNANLKNARHEDTLTLDELFQSYKRLLKDSGRIYMIHRANRLIDIINVGGIYNIKVSKMQFVYDRRIKNAKTVLLELRKGTNSNIIVEEAKYI